MTRRTSEDWREIIHAQQSSGLNQTEFCKQQGLNSKYFSIRKGKLASEKLTSNFVKAKRLSSLEMTAKPTVRLEVKGIGIQLEGVSPQFISELVQCLA